MKSCPKCGRLYADETFQFCLDDGADLKIVSGQKAEQFAASVPTFEREKPAKKFQWLAFSLLGGIAVFVVLGVAAAALYVTLRRGDIAQNQANTAENTNVPIISTPLFGTADEETEIKNLMEKVAVAFVKNDTATLDKFMADEYLEENSNGVKASKKDFMKPEAVGERISLRYSDLKVAVSRDRAIVTGTGESKFRLLGTVLTQTFTFKSQLVKRDNRWQGVYSYTEYAK